MKKGSELGSQEVVVRGDGSLKMEIMGGGRNQRFQEIRMEW